MSDLNIYARLSAITAELNAVAKNLTVDTGKGKGYKAVSEVDVLNAVKPLEVKHGVYSYPAAREVLESAMLESDTQYGKKTTFFTRIKTTYRFVNIDKPEEFIETTTFSEGIDAQDKGSGKAMTYGDKYALLKAYKIITGEDPDAEVSKEESYKRNVKPVICEGCGKSITAVKSSSGEMWKPEQIAAYSSKRFGRKLCADCQKEASR